MARPLPSRNSAGGYSCFPSCQEASAGQYPRRCAARLWWTHVSCLQSEFGAGRIKPSIKTILSAKQKQLYTMEAVISQGIIHTKPAEIHTLLTDNFHSWYASPEGDDALSVSLTPTGLSLVNPKRRSGPDTRPSTSLRTWLTLSGQQRTRPRFLEAHSLLLETVLRSWRRGCPGGHEHH